MGEWVKLQASDGTELEGYVARPEGEAIGALVVVQEIFGVNPSIQAVADSYAKDGFVAIAPALFDRIEKGVQLGYGPDDMKKAFALFGQLKPETAQRVIKGALFFGIDWECSTKHVQRPSPSRLFQATVRVRNIL